MKERKPTNLVIVRKLKSLGKIATQIHIQKQIEFFI